MDVCVIVCTDLDDGSSSIAMTSYNNLLLNSSESIDLEQSVKVTRSR